MSGPRTPLWWDALPYAGGPTKPANWNRPRPEPADPLVTARDIIAERARTWFRTATPFGFADAVLADLSAAGLSLLAAGEADTTGDGA